MVEPQEASLASMLAMLNVSPIWDITCDLPVCAGINLVLSWSYDLANSSLVQYFQIVLVIFLLQPLVVLAWVKPSFIRFLLCRCNFHACEYLDACR